MSAYEPVPDSDEFKHWEREHCENLLRRLRFLEKQLSGEDLERPASMAVKKAGNELKALAWVLYDIGYIEIKE